MPTYTLPYTGVLDVPANSMLGNNTGSAAAAIGMTQAQTLTFLGDPGGAFGADVDTQITPSTAVVLDHATNNEAALSLAYTTNKAAGDDTGLLISLTDTASPGTSFPLDVQVGGTSVLSVDEAGQLSLPYTYPIKFDSQFGYDAVMAATGMNMGFIGYQSNQLVFKSIEAEFNLSGSATGGYGVAATASGLSTSGDAYLLRNSAAGKWLVTDSTKTGGGELAADALVAGTLTATAPLATDIPVSITGAAAQSANLFEIGANGGAAGDLFSVDETGALLCNALTVSGSGGIYDWDTVFPGIRMRNDGAVGLTGIMSGGSGGGQYFAISTGGLRVALNASLAFASSTYSIAAPNAHLDSTTTDIIRVRNNDNTALGQLNTGLLTAVAPAATDIPVSITGAAAQSANLFEIGANGGAAGDLFKIDSAGLVTFGGSTSGIVPDELSATGTPSASTHLRGDNTWATSELSKSITIEDSTSTEDISLWFSNKAITITEIRAVLVGSLTPSVTWTIRHGADRSAAGAEAVTGGTTTTSTTSGSDVTSFNDATIAADSFIWLETTAQSGTVDEIDITIFFTID